MTSCTLPGGTEHGDVWFHERGGKQELYCFNCETFLSDGETCE